MHCFGRWDLTLGAHCRTGALSQKVRERAPHEKHDHRPHRFASRHETMWGDRRPGAHRQEHVAAGDGICGDPPC